MRTPTIVDHKSVDIKAARDTLAERNRRRAEEKPAENKACIQEQDAVCKARAAALRERGQKKGMRLTRAELGEVLPKQPPNPPPNSNPKGATDSPTVLPDNLPTGLAVGLDSRQPAGRQPRTSTARRR
jgi:hypothetical protein